MEWVRSIPIGRGTSATVHLALPKSDPDSAFPSHFAVKSSDPSTSVPLRNELHVLRRLGHHSPHIISCFGDHTTSENGRLFYNVFFEYAPGGSLSDHLRRSPGSIFPEIQVRNYTNSILRGLEFIHDSGFAHCDVKLQNVLLFGDGQVKISDFGLAKEVGGVRGGFELRGTPLYMAPEVVAGGSGDAPADVWALGCAVVEMATGKPAWRCEPECGVAELLCRIGAGDQTPEIPESLSEEGRDFVSRCFIKDPRERWTARMLLDHPFVSGMCGEDDTKPSASAASPTGPFDFPDWTPSADVSYALCSPNYSAEWGDDWEEESCASLIMERIEKLVGNPVQRGEWAGSDSDGWVTVR